MTLVSNLKVICDECSSDKFIIKLNGEGIFYYVCSSCSKETAMKSE